MSQSYQQSEYPTSEQHGGTGQSASQYGGQSQAESRQGDQQPRPRQFQTTSYLSTDVREQVIQCLNRTLADATVLQTQARFAHWNVKGMSFHGLHETFEEIVEALAEHIDMIGERITALGGQAMGTAGMAVSACRLPQMPQDVYAGPQFVDVVVERMAVFDANLYQDIQTANQLEDLDTADLLNEVSREVSKLRWFLEAHCQTQPIGTAGQGTAGGSQQAVGLQQQQAFTQPGGQGQQGQSQTAGQSQKRGGQRGTGQQHTQRQPLAQQH